MDRTALRQQLRVSLVNAMSQTAEIDRTRFGEIVRREIQRLDRAVRKALTESDVEELIGLLFDDILGLGPLQPLLNDAQVTEIMVLAPDVVYIEKDGRKTRSEVCFSDTGHVRTVVERMMQHSSRRLDERNPYCDFALTDGSRVHVIIPPLAERYPQITIRKFLDTIHNLDDLVRRRTLTEAMADFLEACMRVKKNLLFSGATGSGKTTTLAAMSAYIDPEERIVSIEDTRELMLKQRHVVYLSTRAANIEGTGEVTLRDLLRNSLRMRPSRILLGEIRGPEALDYLQALTSGHRGCGAVLHASNPRDAVTRLETLALFAGLNLPVSAIRRQIAAGLDIVIQQEQQSDGSRKITHISEVRGIAENEVVLQDLFRYELESTDEQGRVHGRFAAVSPPRDLSYFTRRGVHLPASTFESD